MPKKKVNNQLPNYLASAYEQEAYMWGVEEGYIISPLGTKTPGKWKIGIATHWKPKEMKVSPEVYDKTEIWQKVYDFYIYYYEKRSKSDTD